MSAEEKIKNFIKDDNVWKRVLLLALVVFFVIALWQIFSGLFGSGTTPPGTSGTFQPQYIAKTENIEVPGAIPIELLVGPTLELESSSYFTQSADGHEMYVYDITSSNNVEILLNNAKSIFEENNFLIIEENEFTGGFVGSRDNERLTYEIVDLGEGRSFVTVIYKVFGSL